MVKLHILCELNGLHPHEQNATKFIYIDSIVCTNLKPQPTGNAVTRKTCGMPALLFLSSTAAIMSHAHYFRLNTAPSWALWEHYVKTKFDSSEPHSPRDFPELMQNPSQSTRRPVGNRHKLSPLLTAQVVFRSRSCRTAPKRLKRRKVAYGHATMAATWPSHDGDKVRWWEKYTYTSVTQINQVTHLSLTLELSLGPKISKVR